MKDQVIKLKSNSPKGVQCVIGGFILCLSFSSDFSYPNINSYLTSYMRNNNTNGYNNYLTWDICESLFLEFRNNNILVMMISSSSLRPRSSFKACPCHLLVIYVASWAHAGQSS